MVDISTDPEFEYDAPTYIDFNLLQQGKMEDDNADAWFDHHADLNSNAELGQETFEDSFVPEDSATSALLTLPSSEVKVKTEVKSEVQEEVLEREKQVTGKKSTSAIMEVFAAGMEEIKRQKEERTRQSKKRARIQSLQSPEKPPKRACREAAQKASTSIHSILSNSRTTKAALPSVSSDPAMKCEAKTKPTQPQAKSTEELQMEEIQRLQKEAKKKLRESRKSFRKLAKSSAPVPVKYSKKPTEAHEFNFKTKGRERMKFHGQQHPAAVHPNQFPMTLRSSTKGENFHPMIPSTKPPTPDGVTKVNPFKFQLDSRMTSKQPGNSKNSDIVPVAEAIQKFQTATPPRFRSRKASDDLGGIQKSSSNTALTMPHTPNLVSRKRSRPVTVKSAAEIEEEEMAKMKESQFKAKALNPEIFRKGGLFGVPCKHANPITKPKTPQLATVERFQQKKRDAAQADQGGEGECFKGFHANPLPKDIFERVKGVPEKRPRAATCPESPALALKRRRLEEPSKDQDEEEQDSHIIHANPMPQFDSVFKPQLPHKTTEIQPFTFEERYQGKPTRETLVQQILQKEKKSDFKAQPLPNFAVPPSLLPKSTQQPTKPTPFTLQTEVRGQQHTSMWLEKVAEEALKAKQEAEFKAKDASALYQRPFVPLRSSQPLTEVSNFVLHSEVRHEQRAIYEADKQQREQAREQENKERQALKAAEEGKELIEYRKSLVHKAQSVQQYGPIEIKPSTKSLTCPKAPVFHSDSRLRGVKTDV